MSPGHPPTVTVLLPVFNGARFLPEAIASVLAQTWRDFELLIIDDGSTDESAAVAGSYRDARLRVERNPTNRGLVYTLNRGLDLARGVLIARMDADDICRPKRLEKQVAFMEANPGVHVCGSGIGLIGVARAQNVTYPTDHDHIRCRLLFANPLAHPTVMWRAEAFRAAGLRYDAAAAHAEDYDLWQRSADRLRFANLPDVLLDYRISPESVTHKHRDGLARSVAVVLRRMLSRLDMPTDEATVKLHLTIGNELPLAQRADLLRARAHLVRLWLANQRLAVYPPAAFREMLHYFWESTCGKYQGTRWLVRRLYPSRELGTGSGAAAALADGLAGLGRALALRRQP